MSRLGKEEMLKRVKEAMNDRYRSSSGRKRLQEILDGIRPLPEDSIELWERQLRSCRDI